MALMWNPEMWNYEQEYHNFERQVEATRLRVATLNTNTLTSESRVEDLFEELNVSVEELTVAQEEMRQQNEELVASRAATEEATHRYQELFNYAPDAYFVTSRDGTILEANRAAAQLLNVPQEQLIGKPLVVFIDSEARRAFRSELARLAERNGRVEWETRLQPRHRLYIDAQFSVSAAPRAGGADELRWTARDITDKKRDEAQIIMQLNRIEAINAELEAERNNLEKRVAERTAELQFEISERVRAEERLSAMNQNLQRAMTETHHRVKNNLQMVSALLDLQAQDIMENPQNTRETLQRLTTQIRTMAALHDALTHQAKEDGNVDTIPAGAILERLISLARQTADKLKLHNDFADVDLPTPRAMALAIIANELISNAVKHGGREVSIALRAESERAILEICDDGPGFPPDFRPERSANIGLDLVNSMTRHDLTGQAHYLNLPDGGACVRIVFPLLYDEAVSPAS